MGTALTHTYQRTTTMSIELVTVQWDDSGRMIVVVTIETTI